MKKSVKEIIETGTTRQKAILLIHSEYVKTQIGGKPLTEAEEKSVYESVKHSPVEYEKLQSYLSISRKYALNRYVLYSQMTNIQRILARIADLCHIWELAEEEAEFCNWLLAHNKDKEIEAYIYKHSRNWLPSVGIVRKTDKSGKDLKGVRTDLTKLKDSLDGEVADYSNSMAVVKGFIVASDELVEKYKAKDFIPEDVREILNFFKAPYSDVPELYRRDIYLKELKEKGAESFDVKCRAKYAILPAVEEIEPLGTNNVRKILGL